jgi:hypothetical protein
MIRLLRYWALLALALLVAAPVLAQRSHTHWHRHRGRWHNHRHGAKHHTAGQHGDTITRSQSRRRRAATGDAAREMIGRRRRTRRQNLSRAEVRRRRQRTGDAVRDLTGIRR